MTQVETVVDKVRRLAEEVALDHELFVVEVDVRGARGAQVVDVFVDSEGELDVDALAEVSRELGFLLDTEEVIESRYNLNVSSPGLDRPLVSPRQYAKHIGRELVVKIEGEDEPLFFVGELTQVEEEAFVLALDEDEHEEGGEQTVAFEDVLQAQIRLPW